MFTICKITSIRLTWKLLKDLKLKEPKQKYQNAGNISHVCREPWLAQFEEKITGIGSIWGELTAAPRCSWSREMCQTASPSKLFIQEMWTWKGWWAESIASSHKCCHHKASIESYRSWSREMCQTASPSKPLIPNPFSPQHYHCRMPNCSVITHQN